MKNGKRLKKLTPKEPMSKRIPVHTGFSLGVHRDFRPKNTSANKNACDPAVQPRSYAARSRAFALYCHKTKGMNPSKLVFIPFISRQCTAHCFRGKSGLQDLNLRPHGPQPCALAKLSQTPNQPLYSITRSGSCKDGNSGKSETEQGRNCPVCFWNR